MPSYIEFDIGTARLTEYDANKFPTVQIDAYGEGNSGVAPYEMHSPHGLISRCHDPEVDPNGTNTLGCPVLYGLDGGQGHAWLQADPRVIPLLPPIKKGGTCSYGGNIKNPSFWNVDGDTGSQTIYVPYSIVNDVATKSMSIAVNVDTAGQESISIIHGSGAFVSILEVNGNVSVVLKNQGGDAYVEVNDDGVVINGPLTLNGSLNAGGPVGALPMAMAIPTVAAFAAVQAQLIAVSAALTALSAAATPAGASAALLAAVSAITSGTISVASGTPVIPAKNTSGV